MGEPSPLPSPLDDVPELFRGALARELAVGDHLLAFVCTPVRVSVGRRSPASILAFTDSDWIVIQQGPRGALDKTRCGYADTMLIDFMTGRLHACLRIDFVFAGGLRPLAIEFDPALEGVYLGALRRLLNALRGARTVAGRESNECPPLVSRWPAVLPRHHLWCDGALSPQVAFAAQENELVLVSEEIGSSPPSGPASGRIATYCPLSRLEGFRISNVGILATVGLHLKAAEVSQTILVDIPAEHKTAVSGFLEAFLRRKR